MVFFENKKKKYTLIQNFISDQVAERFFSLPEKNIEDYRNNILPLVKEYQPLGISYLYLKGNKLLPTIYLVHGMGATMHFFYEGILFLHSLGFSVVSHSRCGDRQKEESKNLTIEKYLSDMEEMFRFLKLKEVHILSSSFGSILSILFAHRNPSKVLSITTICGFLNFAWTAGHDIIRDILNRMKIDNISARSLGPWAPQMKFIKRRSAKVLDFILAEYETIPFKNFLVALEELKQLKYDKNPPAIDVPMLLIHGADDTVVTNHQFVTLCNAYPKAKNNLMFETGHGPFLSKPAEMYKMYLIFLRDYFA